MNVKRQIEKRILEAEVSTGNANSREKRTPSKEIRFLSCITCTRWDYIWQYTQNQDVPYFFSTDLFLAGCHCSYRKKIVQRKIVPCLQNTATKYFSEKCWKGTTAVVLFKSIIPIPKRREENVLHFLRTIVGFHKRYILWKQILNSLRIIWYI